MTNHESRSSRFTHLFLAEFFGFFFFFFFFTGTCGSEVASQA